MAFRLPPDRLKSGIATVADAQLARLSKGHETPILEQRKSLKKLRALLSLAATDANAKAVRRCDRILRDAGRSLGSVRDDSVLRNTLSRLVDIGLPARTSLVRALSKELDRIDQQKAGPPPGIAVDAIAARIFAIDLRGVTLHTAIVAAGRSYRAARRGRTYALACDTSDAAHEWRKTVQRHARHMQLLAELWPADLEMRVAAAKDMARDLGEDHDLYLFATWLSGLRLPSAERRAAAELQTAITRHQRQLLDGAFTLGAKVFAERPRCFRRRLSVYARHQSAIKIA